MSGWLLQFGLALQLSVACAGVYTGTYIQCRSSPRVHFGCLQFVLLVLADGRMADMSTGRVGGEIFQLRSRPGFISYHSYFDIEWMRR